LLFDTEHHNKLNDLFGFLSEHGDQQNSELMVDQLSTLHGILIKCQELGDQKVALVSQIIEAINNKSKQLTLDTKSLGA
jgi:hypothetical protein